MKIKLRNSITGKIIETKVGYSWTVLFFGFIPPLFRKDWKWAGIIFGSLFLSAFLLSIIGIDANISIVISAIFGYYYNATFIREKIESGWVPADEISEEILIEKGLYQKPFDAEVTLDIEG